MSIYDKSIKSVAEAALKIMQKESSHGSEPKTEKEKSLAALAHPKDKVTHKDVLVGRGVLKKEEVEINKSIKKGDFVKDPHGNIHRVYDVRGTTLHTDKYRGNNSYGGTESLHITKATKIATPKSVNEEVKEQTEVLQEGWDDMMKASKERSGPQPSGGAGIKQGTRYGGGRQKDEPEHEQEDEKPKRGKYGARQNYKRSTRVNESFTQFINDYKEKGLQAIAERTVEVEEETINEEPDNAQFTKEFEDQKASMEGKKKQPHVAAASTQGVKQMPEEYEVIDANEVNGVTVDTIEERSLSEPEMKKKEEYVKGMKKKMPGFKERYGERAKEVMYATATRMAKDKA